MFASVRAWDRAARSGALSFCGPTHPISPCRCLLRAVSLCLHRGASCCEGCEASRRTRTRAAPVHSVCAVKRVSEATLDSAEETAACSNVCSVAVKRAATGADSRCFLARGEIARQRRRLIEDQAERAVLVMSHNQNHRLLKDLSAHLVGRDQEESGADVPGRLAARDLLQIWTPVGSDSHADLRPVQLICGGGSLCSASVLLTKQLLGEAFVPREDENGAEEENGVHNCGRRAAAIDF